MSEQRPQVVQPGGGGGGGPVETLSELLCCYICADRLRDASLCPHCSKMGCYTCIKRWVTKNRANCPHCRAPLTESSLIKVPLFDELRHELEQLPTNPLEGNQQFKERRCSHHKEKVSVYCETCRLCICHECVLWENSPHHSHSYVKLEVLLQKQKKICELQLRKLHEHMKGVLNQVQCVERKMEGVRGSKIKMKREMKDAFEKMTERLEGQYEDKQRRLGDTRQKLKSQAMQITRVTRELESKITSGSITSLLNENGELREDVLHKLEELQSMKIEPIPSIGELFNELVPNYCTGVFKIHPYQLRRQQGEEIYSKPLHVCGTLWKLKVYPNGHREDAGVYLSVFLELTEGYERPIKYQYCIEMLFNCSNKHPSRNYKKEYESDFRDGESWGYRRFYELAKLENDGYLREDTVVLRFSVRNLNNHQKCKDLSAQVRRLEHKLEGLQRELKAKKEAVSSSSGISGGPVTSAATSEEVPGDYPHSSPSQSRSARHQHTQSEPISPGSLPPPHSPQPREERRHSREEQTVGREHESHHQHHTRERHYDQERRRGEGQRRRGQRERGVYRDHLHLAMSQQPTMRSHHSQSVQGGYLSQQRHSDSRLTTIDPPPPQQISYRYQSRDSSEALQRRRSADPAMLQQHFESPISPPTYRHTLAPPRSSAQESFHFRHDSVGSGTEEGHEFGSQTSLARSPRFEEGSGDDEGGSQPHPWGGEPLSHSDIKISISDGGHLFPPSSTQQGQHPLPRVTHHHGGGGHLHFHHTHSQEQFIDDDETGGGGGGGGRVDAMLGGPLSSQIPFYDLYDEGHVPSHGSSKCDMPSHTSALSQPVVSSRRRLQSSVPDLSMLTSNTNLAHTQFLSQSVLDMPRHGHRSSSGVLDHMAGLRSYHDAPPRSNMSSSRHAHLHQMSSDPHLNSEGVQHPGLQRTLLTRLREEPEHSPSSQQRRQHRGGGGGGQETQLQSGKKGYRERRSRKYSPSPQPRPAELQASDQRQKEEVISGPALKPTSSGGSSGSNAELTPTNPQPPQPTSPSRTRDHNQTTTQSLQFPGLAVKSSSNTSLSNLDLI